MGGLYKRGIKRARTGAPKVSEVVRRYVSKRIAKAGEKKWVTIQWNVTTTTNVNNIHLTAISQGDDVFYRTGNMIRGQHLKIRMGLLANNTGASEEMVRVILYSPKDPAVLFTGSPQQYPDPQMNRVYYDKLIGVSALTAASGGNTVREVNLDIPLNVLIQYDGANSNDYSKNPLFLYVTSTATADGPINYGSSLLEYTDK